MMSQWVWTEEAVEKEGLESARVLKEIVRKPAVDPKRHKKARGERKEGRQDEGRDENEQSSTRPSSASSPSLYT